MANVFASLTSSIDFADCVAAVLLAYAAVAGKDIVIAGAKNIIRVIRGA